MNPRRSTLVLPASNWDMAVKAAGLPADQVVLDLEDGVPEADKEGARQGALRALRDIDFGERAVSVRINRLGHQHGLRDLTMLVSEAGERLDSVVLPKVRRPAEVVAAELVVASLEAERDRHFDLRLEAQIEDPTALEAAYQIARASPRLRALVFGPGDFAAAMGMPQTEIGAADPSFGGDIWYYPLMRLTVAAHAAGVAAVDGPYSRLNDAEGASRSARRSAALGMDGKWAIHPAQLEPINRAFTPSEEQLQKARQILSTLDARGGASRLGSEMVDEVSRRMAETVLRRSGTGPA